MNLLMILAFIIASLVVGVTVLTSTKNASAFIDYHGALVVGGGTFACAAIAYQIDRLWLMIKVFVTRMIKGRKPDYKLTIVELMHLAEAYRSSEEKFRTALDGSNDHFIQECGHLLLDGVIEKSELERVLRNRVKTVYKRYSADAAMFLGLSKYPPAMGLMGAVIGMVALLRSLGEPGAEKLVGPAMSIALIATFYGIALANLVVMPVGDNLMDSAREVKTKNEIIVEGILLVGEKTNPIVLAEELNSFLLPGERVDWRSDSGGTKQEAA